MSYKEGYIKGFTGVKIFYRQYLAQDADKTVIVVHGLGEHSGRYQNLIEYFQGKKTNFCLIDNRGHGRSEGKRGHVQLFGQYLDDLRIFVEEIREAHYNYDLFLLGHSMGGNIIANYLIQRDSYFSGAILSGPGFKIAAKINPLKAVAGKLLSNFVPELSLSNDLNTAHLSHDPAVVQAYENDSLVHRRVTARWFTQFIWAGEFALNNARFIKCPVLLLQGKADQLVDPNGAEIFYQNLTVADKKIHLFDGLYHEIFNEPEKAAVFDIMENWMNQRCAGAKKTINFNR